MSSGAARRVVSVCALACVAALVRPAIADERARLDAALDDRRVSSSPEALLAFGEEASTFRAADMRIAAWLFVAEGLSERAARPAHAARYALLALAEPTVTPVDRGRAVVVLASARVVAGDLDGAISLAEREVAVAPGLARRLARERRAAEILSLSRCGLGVTALGGLIALMREARRSADARAALARRVFDRPVWLAAAAVAFLGPWLARAVDPAIDGEPFLRVALGIVLVHAALAAARRYLRPALAAALALGSFVFVAAWAYLGSARPLPEWAAP